MLNELVRGKISKRAYEVDVHAWIFIKRILRKNKRVDAWIECKNLKTSVKRMHVNSLIRKAQDLREGWEEGFEEWYADILMIFSTSGFDIDAIRIANEHDIYLVNVDRKYDFVGNMTREGFNELIVSRY